MSCLLSDRDVMVADMNRRPDRPPLLPEERYRMRRLTEEELARLCQLARQGRKGPEQALDALWDLIMSEATSDGSARPERFWVQDYAIARDQADALLAAMTQQRRLPQRVVSGFHLMWVSYSPADYDPDAIEPDRP